MGIFHIRKKKKKKEKDYSMGAVESFVVPFTVVNIPFLFLNDCSKEYLKFSGHFCLISMIYSMYVQILRHFGEYQYGCLVCKHHLKFVTLLKTLLQTRGLDMLRILSL